MKRISLFSPGTIANISCGFDVLGVALDEVGDIMHIEETVEPGWRISAITGADLPLAVEKNTAGVAGLSLLNAYKSKVGTHPGFHLVIEKKIKAGSGIGSSAASASGAVWGLNELLGRPFTPLELVGFAMEGEKLASGVAHADNVAPGLFGGFTLVRSYAPLDIVALPCPNDLYAVVLHPQIEIKTQDARSILKTQLSLKQATTQWGNLGGLIAGLYTDDYGLISRSLVDVVVEPIRSLLIPGFDELKKTMLDSGALGAGISGSGPSVFALAKGSDQAHSIAQAIDVNYRKWGIDFEVHCAKINTQGIKILNE
ncbi:MAG: Homoserine kinase [Bacteroidota bacterium]|jgi:homoserine kinase